MSNSTEGEHNYDWNGVILKKKYICITKLGHGAYSAVWLGYNLNTKKIVAIKIHNSYDSEHGDREYELYKTLNKLNIPHILNPIEKLEITHEENEHYCIIMELMGCSLYDLMKMNVLTPEIIKKIMKQIFECLMHLHKNNYVHGDFKPENILIQGYTKEILDIVNNLNKLKNINEIKNYVTSLKIIYDENSESEKYSSKSTDISIITRSDYSISREKKTHYLLEEFIENPNIYISDLGSCINLNTTTYYKKFYNTCYYVAPEVLLKLDCDSKTDIWSVGCTLYELLTNRILFDPDDVSIMKNRYHLSQIIRYLGNIPKEMRDKSPVKEVFFKNNGLMKGINKIDHNNFWDSLFEKNSNLFILILELLEIDPANRISAEKALQKINSLE